MFTLDKIIRPHIREVKPYSSARDEFKGHATYMLDANENPYNNGVNRYPDPHQIALKELIASLKGVSTSSILLGNGSDEAIDLIFRLFCEPSKDKVLQCTPTYGMYQVVAAIHPVEMIDVPLRNHRYIDSELMDSHMVDERCKVIFLCSPNNPLGHVHGVEEVVGLAQKFHGVVVVDEAYIDFSDKPSLLTKLTEIPNLIVLQTFSKAWGLAGIRLGMLFANEAIISLLSRIKLPYNVSSLAIARAMQELQNRDLVQKQVEVILQERKRLAGAVHQLPCVTHIFPSEGNFLLVQFSDAHQIYKDLLDHDIVVRERLSLVDNSLRITIGTPEENEVLIRTLKEIT